MKNDHSPRIRRCGDCDVEPGQLHVGGCDLERCVFCGGQSISCNCIYEINGIDTEDMETTHPEIYYKGPTEEMCAVREVEEEKYGGRLPWTGVYPGTEECIEFGWFVKWVEESPRKWQECGPDDPDAVPNVSRLQMGATWDRSARRWHIR